ncbi:4-hydroxy-3-methylbut-2-enyl diphosphate reductase [candidate division NPL-UPA2 bacterium]|nr:4-hydroxy-3-methylbut-2-enyl diphosphate reductase [candidate division NPL-UPA2 bacterium]
MKVELASHSGFCFGVKRAIKLAFQAADDEKAKPVYSLGPLIHNPQVVEELKRKGVKVIEDLKGIREGTLIIRSHGVHPSVLTEAEDAGLEIVDATCPLVKRVQDLAKILDEESYSVVIIGERGHYEVKALLGFAGDKALVIESLEEAKRVKKAKKLGILSQTTQSVDNFKEIVGELSLKVDEMELFNTICEATRKRQEATLDLSRKVDLMLVLGGHESANTRRLAQISQETGTETHHLETAEEINPGWLKGKEKVGVTAGASTPDWIIEEVLDKLKNSKVVGA